MKWKEHPILKPLIPPGYPDDVPAIVHEGFRAATTSPEKVWIRISDMSNSILTATLLNSPHQLPSLTEGNTYLFQISSAGIPVLVSDSYLKEIVDWRFAIPCKKCGNDVLFDNPSTIMRIAFPNMPANSTMDAFSTFCPLCSDPIVLRHKDTPEEEDESPSFAKPKKWYEFWK